MTADKKEKTSGKMSTAYIALAAGEVISCCIFGQILAGALKKYKSELDPKNNR